MTAPVLLDTVEMVPGFAELGVLAFTTTRATGSFSSASEEASRTVLARWDDLRRSLGSAGRRFATASQVHGATVLRHESCWEGWLRAAEADGHAALDGGMSFGVTVADCTPVFIAHPDGAIALLHAGWRGVAAGIATEGVRLFQSRDLRASDLHVHLGPSICGRCYEVGPEVHAALTGKRVGRPMPIDVRAVLSDELRAAGVRQLSVSERCTRCDNDTFFSHRCGDAGRQLGVIASMA